MRFSGFAFAGAYTLFFLGTSSPIYVNGVPLGSSESYMIVYLTWLGLPGMGGDVWPCGAYATTSSWVNEAG